MSEIMKENLNRIGGGIYLSPEVNVILFQPEGVLCTSGDHAGYEPDGEYEIE